MGRKKNSKKHEVEKDINERKGKSQWVVSVNLRRTKFAGNGLGHPQVCQFSAVFFTAMLVTSRDCNSPGEPRAQAVLVHREGIRGCYVYLPCMHNHPSRGTEL